MNTSSGVDIKPIDVKEFTCKQSKHSEVVPHLPLHGVLLSPPGGGKSVLLANLMLKVYRGCFERIYMFSPSIDVDSTWVHVKQYIEDVMKVKEIDDENLYFSDYKPDNLGTIISTHYKLIVQQKQHKDINIYIYIVF